MDVQMPAYSREVVLDSLGFFFLNVQLNGTEDIVLSSQSSPGCLQLTILLPQHGEGWDYRCVSLHPAVHFLFGRSHLSVSKAIISLWF
jgi:hypothetical protein